MKPRSLLFRKYLIAFVAVTGLLLLVTEAASLYFSYQDSRSARFNLQRESAEAAASRIEQRLSAIVHQIGLTAPLAAGQDALVQREHEIRLLSQLPGISDILLLDHEGRERLLISRHGTDVAGSKTDYSRNVAFQEAKSRQPYFSPVYFRGDSEPHITISMAVGPEQAGVTVAEIDLRFLLDGIGQIAAAAGGHAFVLDARGQLIAQADPALKLQKSGSVAPPQSGTSGMVAPLGWHVSIEPAQYDALAPLYGLAQRSALLLLAGLLLAVPAGFALVRYLTRPMREMQESVDLIVEDVLDEPVLPCNGDELETLAVRFNQVVTCLRESQAQLERKVEERTAAAQEAQRLAERAHKRLAEMIEGLPLAVYQFRESTDGELSFTFVSENARDILGVSAAEIMADKQARWRTTLPEDRIVIEPVLHRAYAAHQSTDFHQRVQFAGGTRWVRSYTAAPKQVDDGWVWTGCWLDKTQERKREEEMRAAKDTAEALARTRSNFLVNISHEIRTPLNTIIGLSHLALKTDMAPQHFDCVSKIHQAGTGLFGIMNDILDFARIDAGKLVLETTSFMLGHIVESVAAATGPAASDKGLTLTFDIPSNMPQSLTGDPARLEQILTNLVRNAIKFTERGEITVRAERVYSTDKQVMLRFLVQDTGIGMTAEQRSRLFQGPLRDGAALARKHGGIGLGLVICKRLAEMMGGGFSVESKQGVGSTFSFTARFGLGKERDQAQSGGIEGMRVLLVEDNAVNQQVATELLEGAGARVEVADNGRIALDKLKADASFDIVLMDLQMPEMDGYTATAALRSDPALAELPVVALTAHSTAEDRARCFETGMNDHLTKPINPTVLFDTLKRWDLRPQDEKIAASLARKQQLPPNALHARRGAETIPSRAQPDNRTIRRISNETFQQLVGYLSSGDPMSLDCFAAHRAELTSALGSQASQVEQAIGKRDFETALNLLDAAMMRLDIGFER